MEAIELIWFETGIKYIAASWYGGFDEAAKKGGGGVVIWGATEWEDGKPLWREMVSWFGCFEGIGSAIAAEMWIHSAMMII